MQLKNILGYCDELSNSGTQEECRNTVQKILEEPDIWSEPRVREGDQHYSLKHRIEEEDKYTYDLIRALQSRNEKADKQEQNPLFGMVGSYEVEYIPAGKHDYVPPPQVRHWVEYLMVEQDMLPPNSFPYYKRGEQTKAYYIDENGKEAAVNITRLLERNKSFLAPGMDPPDKLLKLMTKLKPMTPKKMIITISMDPYDITRKSTGQKWTSCERVGQNYTNGIWSDIENYNAIAYFTLEGNKHPSSRALLRWCINDSDKGDVGIEDITQEAPAKVYTDVGQTTDQLGVYKVYGDETAARMGLQFLREYLQARGYYKYGWCATPYINNGYSDWMRQRHALYDNTSRETATPIIYGKGNPDFTKSVKRRLRDTKGFAVTDDAAHSEYYIKLTPEIIDGLIDDVATRRKLNEKSTFYEATEYSLFDPEWDESHPYYSKDMLDDYKDWTLFPKRYAFFKQDVFSNYLVHTIGKSHRLVPVDYFDGEARAGTNATHLTWKKSNDAIISYIDCKIYQRKSKELGIEELGSRPVIEDEEEPCLKNFANNLGGEFRPLTQAYVRRMRKDGGPLRDLCANLKGYLNTSSTNSYFANYLSPDIWDDNKRNVDTGMKELIEKCNTTFGDEATQRNTFEGLFGIQRVLR